MKLDSTHETKDGSTIYVFALGKNEVREMLACLLTSYKNMPALFEFTQHKRRIHNMIKALQQTGIKNPLKKQ